MSELVRFEIRLNQEVVRGWGFYENFQERGSTENFQERGFTENFQERGFYENFLEGQSAIQEEQRILV